MYLDHAWELRKVVEHEGDGDIYSNWRVWNGP